MSIVVLLCAAFVLRVATEPIKTKLGVQPNMTQEATPGPLSTQAVERKTEEEPLVTEAGNRTLGDTMSSGDGCLPGWQPYGSRCLKLYTTPKTWIDAEKYCMMFGAHLASIHNPEEHDFLHRLASGTNQKRAWIGGSDAVKNLTWLWTDGSRFDYTNWASGEPNNRAGEEKCNEIIDKGWNDQNCEDSLPFICGTRPDGQL
ncbi:galactose-specific lectin nattectin-like [Scomber scombrus]|uniref:Galactose-specific lectin nattectin-like n=1 Tax=Scomber scombrus TaxID=13677 RepID=A0AAV1QA63_SCOSC